MRWDSAGDMDKTIGGTYKIIQIDGEFGYRLHTEYDTRNKYNYWYPVEALGRVVGEQLLFNFMNEVTK